MGKSQGEEAMHGSMQKLIYTYDFKVQNRILCPGYVRIMQKRTVKSRSKIERVNGP